MDNSSNSCSDAEDISSIDTVIVGGRFACIPLLIELDRTYNKYIIISDLYNGEYDSIWREMNAANRLTFDLVSSLHTSYYSYDLVNESSDDRHPTSKEFYQYQTNHLKKYLNNPSKMIDGKVIKIENFDNYSMVYYQTNNNNNNNIKCIKATHVVLGTGFHREINKEILGFNPNIVCNQTIVFTTATDSTNMMMAQLMARKPNYVNKIILITNGFNLFDKMAKYDNGVTYTLDQLEVHNYAKFSTILYKFFFTTSEYHRFKLSAVYPKVRRKGQVNRFWKSKQCPNGFKALKCWPIDTYYDRFGDNLETSIVDGHVLDDLAYFIDCGLVQIFRHNEVNINKEKKSITVLNDTVLNDNKNVIKYDYLIDYSGKAETPNLPKISKMNNSTENNNYNEFCFDYRYKYRENYFGIIPKKLNNIYFVGFTRPVSGGNANINEIQCLLIHKIINDKQKHNQIYKNIENKILNYNNNYYGNNKELCVDHIVIYGFYIDEVAKEIGIDLKMPLINIFVNWKKFYKWFIYPNNTLKYRQFGEYRIKKAYEKVNDIFKKHKYIRHHAIFMAVESIKVILKLIVMLCIIKNVVLIQNHSHWIDLLYMPYIFLTYFNQMSVYKNVWLLFILGIVINIIILLCYFYVLLCNTYVNDKLVLIFCIILNSNELINDYLAQTSLCRGLFNDLRVKRKEKYHQFWKKYCQAYHNTMVKT